MGHRIFKGRDPRAAILEKAAETLPTRYHLETARALERAAAAGAKPLFANVELYTAVVLDAVGIPKKLFTPTFAVARIAGWCAHIAEQRASGKLIQPNARYIGPPSL
jgi:citrate synthase